MNVNPEQNTFLMSVTSAIRKHSLISPGDSVLAAVSGGADSVALVHALKVLGLRPGVAHMNHGLRGNESDEDAEFVAFLSQSLDLPFFMEKKDVFEFRKQNRLSLEEAAREVRYSFLQDIAARYGYHRIATAHHADDNIELVLMNLMRGSGLQGLGGMPFKSTDGRLIRPLLDTGKEEILEYVKQNGLSFRTDSSNTDTAFTRNKIRHHLIPLLEREYQPNIRNIIARTARILREDETWIENEIDAFYSSSVLHSDMDKIILSIPTIRLLADAVIHRVIRRALLHVKTDLKRISQIHTDAVAGLVGNPKPRASLDLPGRMRVQKINDHLVFKKEERPLRTIPVYGSEGQISYSYRVDRPEDSFQTVMIKETGMSLTFSSVTGINFDMAGASGPMTAFADMDKLSFPLVIRNPLEGDRFMPLGMQGKQKVSRYFINNRIEPSERKACPLVVSDNDIVWVCGHRLDERFKIEKNTEKILKIELFLA